MISLSNVGNLAGNLLSWFNRIEIKVTDWGKLPCIVSEISETQDFNAPQYPVESGSYKGDTIYKMPLKVNLRCFVEGGDYVSFEYALNELVNNKNNFVTLSSLGSKTYENLKVVSWARDTNSQMVGATHYNVALQEVILVNSFSAGAGVSKGAYGAVKSLGNKATSAVSNPRSVLHKGFF